MGWHHSSTRNLSNPASYRSLPPTSQLKIALLTLLLLITVFGFFASFSLVIFLTPRPELERWTPEGIKCATCEELMSQNWEVGKGLGCVGWDRDIMGKERYEVTIGGFEILGRDAVFSASNVKGVGEGS